MAKYVEGMLNLAFNVDARWNPTQRSSHASTKYHSKSRSKILLIQKIKNLNKRQKQENTSTDMLLNVTRAPLLKELAKKEKINIRQIHENIN